MQFHYNGYTAGDPRVQPASGVGLNRSKTLPDIMDVLVVGTGPAGMITAAQLSQFPDVATRIIDRRPGPLEVGQADGIQPRSVETFQAFGFADRICEEAAYETEMNFWRPDRDDSLRLVRRERVLDDEKGFSEFAHILCNQARVLDYFAEFMVNAPSRMVPDYGYEMTGLTIDDDPDHPVAVTLRRTSGEDEGTERVVRARYVVGADGAHSSVRPSIGATMHGDEAMHAWGVMDILSITDFPDMRVKCAIQSADGGNLLLIPREGGHLVRMYVDLGEISAGNAHTIRSTSIDEIIAQASKIMSPYALDVKHVAWHSVYEVAHRVADRFDAGAPNVFLTGDACHTHSAKAGQGMNVSMQDGFNLAWKLGYVLTGISPEALLSTYATERRDIAQDLIAFDREWSAMMAKKVDDFDDPGELADYYVRTWEFPAGFMTQYRPSMIVTDANHQSLAAGYPIGKRFKSEPVVRVADARPLHLGHLHQADGRWRLYAFADAACGMASAHAEWADWMAKSPQSPLNAYVRPGADTDWLLDIKAVYPQLHHELDLTLVPQAFLPRRGRFHLIDREKVFALDPDDSIYERRGIDPTRGCVVVVRPDQYVAGVLPLDARAELTAFFRGFLLPG